MTRRLYVASVRASVATTTGEVLEVEVEARGLRGDSTTLTWTCPPREAPYPGDTVMVTVSH